MDQTSGPLWSVAAAVPIAGATPDAVRAVATSLDQALSGLAPAVDELSALTPDKVIDAKGNINLVALEDAAPDLQAAQAGLASASATIADAPSKADGDLVIAQVDAAVTEMREQLAGLEDAFGTANDIASIAPELLGIDGPKRYLVGITNPNEARGTGGFLGTYVILRADEGRITVEQVGSNSDLAEPAVPAREPRRGLPRPLRLGPHAPAQHEHLPALPRRREAVARVVAPDHGRDPRRCVRRRRRGARRPRDRHRPGGPAARRRIAHGRGAHGVRDLRDLREVPRGRRLTRAQGLPGAGHRRRPSRSSPARRTDARSPRPSAPDSPSAASCCGPPTRPRSSAWIDADVAGSLQAPDGHVLDAVAINYSASKLDAYLARHLTYEVGRCADGGRVKSRATFALTNAIPEGADVPEYVMSQAERGPDGPINKTMAQLHLPNGAQITSVTLDGEPIVAYTFTEQGRPSVIQGMDLDPRVERTLVVEFTEPADAGPGTVVPQPLAIDQVTTVVDATCEGPAGSAHPELTAVRASTPAAHAEATRGRQRATLSRQAAPTQKGRAPPQWRYPAPREVGADLALELQGLGDRCVLVPVAAVALHAVGALRHVDGARLALALGLERAHVAEPLAAAAARRAGTGSSGSPAGSAPC